MLNIDKTYQYFSKVFLELINIQQFKTEFQALAPEIYADIESFSHNQNCSCKFKIENYVNMYRDKCSTFLNDFISNHNIDVDLNKIETKYKIVNMSGAIERVKKVDWQNFRDRLIRERAMYKAFSVVQIDDNTIDVYFL